MEKGKNNVGSQQSLSNFDWHFLFDKYFLLV